MVEKCYICNGNVNVVKEKVLLNLPRFGSLILEAEHEKCEKCGEIFFNEKQSEIFSIEADRAIEGLRKKQVEPIKVPSGSVII